MLTFFWYAEGPGVSAARSITRSTSDFGLASEILQAEFRRIIFGVYCPGPGVSLDRFMIQSVSVLGFAVLKRPPPGRDHLPDAEHVTGLAVLGRAFFRFSLAASRSRKLMSADEIGLCFLTGDKGAFVRDVVVLREFEPGLWR